MKVKTLKVTDFRTFSKPLIPCGRCKHYRRVKPNGKRFCTYHGHFANPEDFCAWAEQIEKEERDGSER